MTEGGLNEVEGRRRTSSEESVFREDRDSVQHEDGDCVTLVECPSRIWIPKVRSGVSLRVR